jgi:hypothetical protein
MSHTLRFIGAITTNIVQNPNANVVELDSIHTVICNITELDVVVFNERVYLFHDNTWLPIEQILDIMDEGEKKYEQEKDFHRKWWCY